MARVQPGVPWTDGTEDENTAELEDRNDAAEGGGGGGSDDQTASEVPFTPAGSISATDVQAAIEEAVAEAGGGGAPTDATYLVTTANGSLSAEVVVGATPGGELGGTWASPTVDATHSGSSHAAVQAAAEATAAGALATHEADTTSVHGIADTSALYRSGGTDVAVADGGTGASTAGTARSNLGLGTIATQDASNVAITGGSVTGITDLAVADGGTGASTAAAARTNLSVPLLARTTFSNADATIAATTSYLAQVGTMSAVRTVTLPAANAVTAGSRVTVADESGTVDYDAYISIVRAGSDTILNSFDTERTTSVLLRSSGAVTLISDGTSKWIVQDAAGRTPFFWYVHPRDIAIPTGVWTPIPFNTSNGNDFGYHPWATEAAAPATTIAAGSNGNVLPQATINVASAAAFPSSGYLVIEGPPGSGDDTVVTYTGKTATTFTGCNSAHRGGGVGISTGTLATGQNVRGAFVEFDMDEFFLWQIVVQIALESLATSAKVMLRLRQIDGIFNFPIFSHGPVDGMNIATATDSGIWGPGQSLILTGQPGMMNTDGSLLPARIEILHNAGSTKLIKTSGLESPSMMGAGLTQR